MAKLWPNLKLSILELVKSSSEQASLILQIMVKNEYAKPLVWSLHSQALVGDWQMIHSPELMMAVIRGCHV